jgi:hypothetical protein
MEFQVAPIGLREQVLRKGGIAIKGGHKVRINREVIRILKHSTREYSLITEDN